MLWGAADDARRGNFRWPLMANALGYLAILLGLLAHTFWGLGQAKRIPVETDGEESRFAFRRIARRLWMGLMLLPALCLAWGAFRAWTAIQMRKSMQAKYKAASSAPPPAPVPSPEGP